MWSITLKCFTPPPYTGPCWTARKLWAQSQVFGVMSSPKNLLHVCRDKWECTLIPVLLKPIFLSIISFNPVTLQLISDVTLSDVPEALLLVVGQSCFKQYRVHTILRVQQRHVAVNLHKKVNTLVSLLKVRLVAWQSLRAARAAKCPAWRYLQQQQQKPKNLKFYMLLKIVSHTCIIRQLHFVIHSYIYIYMYFES